MEALSAIGMMAGSASANDSPNEEKWKSLRPTWQAILPAMIDSLRVAGLDLAVQQANDILRKIDTMTAKEFFKMFEELNGRVLHYLGGRTALMIPPSQREYYEKPLRGWEVVADKFPLCTDNIEEASKCLALGRDSACVFHLMGVVQDGLEALAIKLGIAVDPTSDTWNGLISKIEIGITAKQALGPKKTWKTLEPFYSEIVSDIKTVKNAWRNPTMHFRRSYSSDQALKIYARVQDLMTHVSTRLHGPKR